MITIVSGTDRKDSNTYKLAQYIQGLYQAIGQQSEIIDLAEVRESLSKGPFYGKDQPEDLRKWTQQILKSDGLVMVVPEYNGSYPGILKYFIDHMKFPESFENRPVSFVGLGGVFGGLRPVEHLQQVFGYRNAYIFPQRVFMMNVHKIFVHSGGNSSVTDPLIKDLLDQQVKGFSRFIAALNDSGLSANRILASRT